MWFRDWAAPRCGSFPHAAATRRTRPTGAGELRSRCRRIFALRHDIRQTLPAMRTPRHIRSFVLRAGRLTSAQERALTEHWPAYGIELEEEPLDLERIFGRRAPRCLEIGFGAGEVIGNLAENNPHIDYLGIEVHRPGVGRLLLRAAAAGVRNVRVICHDA